MARPAPAASRAVTILSFLTAHASRGFTISELVKHLEMNMASAHAILAVLSDAGFVVRDPAHRTYMLGPALYATGMAAREQHPAIDATIAEAEQLSRALGTEVDVTARAGDDIVVVARCRLTPAPARGDLGNRTPLLAPLGSAFVAWAGPEEIEAWIERSEATGEVERRFRAALEETRQSGFSANGPPIASGEMVKLMTRLRTRPTDADARRQLAVMMHAPEDLLVRLTGRSSDEMVTFRSITAPVFDAAGRAMLGLTVIGPDLPVSMADLMETGRRLVLAATVATRSGHGTFPDPVRSGQPGA